MAGAAQRGLRQAVTLPTSQSHLGGQEVQSQWSFLVLQKRKFFLHKGHCSHRWLPKEMGFVSGNWAGVAAAGAPIPTGGIEWWGAQSPPLAVMGCEGIQ